MQQLDPTLIEHARAGDEAALAGLIARMMPLIRKGAARYGAPGLDFEDVVQEGIIGLFNALRSYDAAQPVGFAGYAAVCINHAQRDACRAALRKKHAPLNFSEPLPADEAALQPGPEEQAIAEERYAATLQRLGTELTELERRAVLARAHGRSTEQAAAMLGCTPKAVANALARARRKLRR